MSVSSEAELAELVASATKPLVIQGGGTRGIGPRGDRLSTTGLNGVVLYEPGALTLVAAAGTRISEIDAVLAKENQRLAFEPMDHRLLLGSSGEPTIGGVVAGNISGPRRIQVGACRDHLLGVRFVDGSGTIIKNGGRVMKNVTGYDLVKLMAGSWGTLGVLSQVSLKVLPRAQTQTTLKIAVGDPVQAVAVMSKSLGSPYEISSAAYDPSGAEVLIRLEGFAASVAHRAGRLTDLLKGFGAIDQSHDAAASARIWKEVRDVEAFGGLAGDVWRLSVKPTDAPRIAKRLNADKLLFDWGGGLIWALVPEGTDLRARAGQFSGHATLIRASADVQARLGMFHPQSAPLQAISEGLRARFDPRGIFNQGLMSTPRTVGA